MSFFGKILSNLLQDHAVDKLANNKAFQELAVKTVDGLAAARAHAEALGRQAVEDPDAVRAAVKEQANTFWDSLKKEVAKDIARMTADAPPPRGEAGTRGEDGKLK